MRSVPILMFVSGPIKNPNPKLIQPWCALSECTSPSLSLIPSLPHSLPLHPTQGALKPEGSVPDAAGLDRPAAAGTSPTSQFSAFDKQPPKKKRKLPVLGVCSTWNVLGMEGGESFRTE